MHPNERAAIRDAFDLTAAMLSFRIERMKAGELDPGPAAALEAVRAGAASPARTPARMASHERSDAAEREAAISKAAREVCDLLVGWCDPTAKVPTKEDVDELFRRLAVYEERRSGKKLDVKNSAFASTLQSAPTVPPNDYFIGRGGRRFSLAEALHPVRLCCPAVFDPPEITS